MHPDLKIAIELQQVDAKIAELTAQIDDLPSRIEAIEAKLEEFIHSHEERKKRLAANQKERKELESDIQEIKEKISKHRDQLYQVKTNEQYRAMQKEIEGEEAKIRGIEDQILEKMIEAEELQKQVSEAAARLEGEKARVQEEHRGLEVLREADIQERKALLARRKEIETVLPASVLDLYERIRKARRGVALAAVRNGFCSACNFALRPQLYNEVRAQENLLTCENCNRILYYIEPAPEGEQGGEEGAQATV